MKLSSKGRYGARAMLDLALHNNGGLVLLKDIAKRQEISIRYLEQIMNSLTASGLTKSFRGKKGGFALAKQPKDITLGDIINVLEGSITPDECVNTPQVCKRANTCIMTDIWKRLKESIDGVLGSVTLEDMIKMHNKKNQKCTAEMYHI